MVTYLCHCVYSTNKQTNNGYLKMIIITEKKHRHGNIQKKIQNDDDNWIIMNDK